MFFSGQSTLVARGSRSASLSRFVGTSVILILIIFSSVEFPIFRLDLIRSHFKGANQSKKTVFDLFQFVLTSAGYLTTNAECASTKPHAMSCLCLVACRTMSRPGADGQDSDLSRRLRRREGQSQNQGGMD